MPHSQCDICNNVARNLLFYISPDSNRGPADSCAGTESGSGWKRRARTAEWRRLLNPLLSGVSMASSFKSRGSAKRRSSSLKEKKSEDPMAKCPLIYPDGPAHSGGLRCHRLVQLCCRAIGSFFYSLHEPMAVQLHCIIEKASVIGEKGVFPHSVLTDTVRVKYR